MRQLTQQQRIARFNRLVERLAQDSSKTMVGPWDEAARREAQEVVEKFKATLDPLAEYSSKLDPKSIKQLGHLVQFVHTTKPVLLKLVELLKALS